MRTLNLTGFKPSDSFSISVSQGAITAGPISVPAWGQPNTGGAITINVHRSNLHVAPSSVRFSVDLSLSDFDTPGPTGDETYDARLHDLIYLWDFDDPGTWTAPVQNLAAHKNRNAGKGPIEANMYRTPGTYNPSVLVIEPSSGKTATASVSVTVTDPDVVFSGAKTICINPVGDSDFTGAPAGALTYQSSLFTQASSAWNTNISATEVRRFLFKGGATHAVKIVLGLYTEAGCYFGSYGTGRAALHTERGVWASKLIDNHCFVSNFAQRADCQYWFVGLEGAGNFDPTAGNVPALQADHNGYDQSFLRYKDTGTITISDCYFHNFIGTLISTNVPANANTQGYGSGQSVLHMDDCVIENFGGGSYVTFQAWDAVYDDTWWVASGVRISQDPAAWDGDLIRAPMRINDAMRQIVKGCDFFHTETLQPSLKLIETPKAHGAIGNCHSNAFEGQSAVLFVNGNKSQTLSGGVMQVNAVIDGNILCAAHCTQEIISSWASGITVRNNLFYVPDQVASFRTFSTGIIFSGAIGNNTLGNHVLEAPSKVYNNTLRNDRTWQNNAGEVYGAPVFMKFFDGNADNPPTPYRSATEYNNLVHMPYTSDPQLAFAPVSDTVLFTPRSTGWVNARGPGILPPAPYAGEPVPTAHPELAPLTSVKDTKPLPGSAALGAALIGDVAYMDILGTTRSAPADKGAWEVA